MNKNKSAHKPTTKRLRALYKDRFAHTEDGEEIFSDEGGDESADDAGDAEDAEDDVAEDAEDDVDSD